MSEPVKTPELGLHITPGSEGTKNFIDFRRELAGDTDDSNMMILDKEVGDLKGKCKKYGDSPITWGMLRNGLNYESS